MPSAFTFLKEWADRNPTSAPILMGSLACFSVVALIGSINIDIKSSLPSVIYVVGVGVVFVLICSAMGSQLVRNAGGLFLLLLSLGWVTCFMWSKVNPAVDTKIHCAVYFWQDCGTIADYVAGQNSVKPAVIQPPSADAPKGDEKQYRVDIQFAGFDRPTIVKLASNLSAVGWNVQDGSRGGERIGTAAHLAEVRYGPDSDQSSAQLLADAINASHVSNRTVRAVQNTDLSSKNLEVWIGQ